MSEGRQQLEIEVIEWDGNSLPWSGCQRPGLPLLFKFPFEGLRGITALDHRIGLIRDGHYRLREHYPEAGRDHGVFPLGGGLRRARRSARARRIAAALTRRQAQPSPFIAPPEVPVDAAFQPAPDGPA